MDNKNTKTNTIFKLLGANYSIIIAVLFALQIANFFAVYLFSATNLFITIIIFIFLFVAFGTLKDFASESSKKRGFAILKIAMVIFAMSLINHFMFSIGSSFNSLEKRDSFFRLSYFFNFAFLISSIALFRKDEFKKVMQNVYDSSILEKFHIYATDDSQNKGDVVLCINKETGKPVVIPQKDRYLHMLILGPTGCGKTSQIILPMINQDLQNHDCGLTVIEPKNDLAEKVYAMAKLYGRKVIYFNPILPDCPYFNPLYGREEDVIENMATTFKMLNPDSPQFFQDMNENLIRNSLKVLKRLMGNKATLIDLARLVQNSGGVGRKMVMEFSRMNSANEAIAKENSDICSWFLNEYLNEKSKTYEHCSGVRSQIAKITSNKYLRKVLNPQNGENDIDFDKHLKENGVIAIATAQGKLRDLGRFLGYFIILQLQSSVFKRPGNENTRTPHYLYVDEFQSYSNPGFADMLTQGRSYRVASHLATQNRALMAMGGGRDGKNFVELVSTNARNVVIFPGGNAIDAKYYSDEFGEVLNKKIQKGISRSKFNPLYGFQKMNYPNVTKRESEEMEARFSASDIIFKEFGEITYRIIQNNSVKIPGVGQISYIPQELNEKLNKMIEEYNMTVFNKEDLSEEDENDSGQNVSEGNEGDFPIIKDPIATIKSPVLKSDNSNNVAIKKPLIAEPKTIDDLPEDDDLEMFYADDSKSQDLLEEVSKIEKPNSKNDFDFMSEDSDDLI